LFRILAAVLPEGLEGGISTSPLSYRYWFNSQSELHELKQKACNYLIDLVVFLTKHKIKTGQYLHLDIEPEPDGVIETSQEFISFFNNHLLQVGSATVAKELNCTISEAQQNIRDHITLCYDVCHFAVGYEDPKTVIKSMNSEGIQIGKIQISAALKSRWESDLDKRDLTIKYFQRFDESVYLHQAVMKTKNRTLERFRDLGPALEKASENKYEEIRTHFHVPIFTKEYESLLSTQSDIVQTLDLWRKNPFSKHLEIETYTWDVLPAGLKTDLVDSICREVNWVKNQLERKR
jgi:hypothetical protein